MGKVASKHSSKSGGKDDFKDIVEDTTTKTAYQQATERANQKSLEFYRKIEKEIKDYVIDSLKRRDISRGTEYVSFDGFTVDKFINKIHEQKKKDSPCTINSSNFRIRLFMEFQIEIDDHVNSLRKSLKFYPLANDLIFHSVSVPRTGSESLDWYFSSRVNKDVDLNFPLFGIRKSDLRIATIIGIEGDNHGIFLMNSNYGEIDGILNKLTSDHIQLTFLIPTDKREKLMKFFNQHTS